MIGRGRAAGQHQFDQRHPDRDAQGLGGHATPDALHRDEPGNELLAEARGVGAGQSLVEMMVGVDEPRHDDMARGVERRLGSQRWRLAARNAFDDLSSFDDDAALGVGRENGERVLDPQTHAMVGSVFGEGRAHRRAEPKGKAFWRASCFDLLPMANESPRMGPLKNVFDA